MSTPFQTALLSVSNKEQLLPFATALKNLGFQLLSTGGTARFLHAHQIPVTEVSEVTGFPEILDGRVKTLHPTIHAGLLARGEQDAAVLAEHHIQPIQLLVVNLYPFQETIAAPDCSFENAIENIDVGGPAMLRAAAKNHQQVVVIVDPLDYQRVLEALQTTGAVSSALRLELARKAFAHTAQYDAAISHYYLEQQLTEALFPQTYTLQLEKKQDLRYGENPHQKAALYVEKDAPLDAIVNAKQLQGKELSYNNVADAEAAWECLKNLPLSSEKAACVIVKHANPCGVAMAGTPLEAYEKAYAADPTSAFGGIIAFNRTLETVIIKKILSQQFVEIVIAPEISPEALAYASQKPAVRILCCPLPTIQTPKPSFYYERLTGGLLIQECDQICLVPSQLKVVTQRHPSPDELRDTLFAWHVVGYVKSNAIVYAKNEATLGIGPGQTSRVMSAKIAAWKAHQVGFDLTGSSMASDAFFPFRDSVDAAAEAGITTIIQPGGSMRDLEVIKAANEHNMAMIFTWVRHFRH